MAAKASSRVEGKSQQMKQPWLEQAFAELWRERDRSDRARPKFIPKPKQARRAKPKR